MNSLYSRFKKIEKNEMLTSKPIVHVFESENEAEKKRHLIKPNDFVIIVSYGEEEDINYNC